MDKILESIIMDGNVKAEMLREKVEEEKIRLFTELADVMGFINDYEHGYIAGKGIAPIAAIHGGVVIKEEDIKLFYKNYRRVADFVEFRESNFAYKGEKLCYVELTREKGEDVDKITNYKENLKKDIEKLKTMTFEVEKKFLEAKTGEIHYGRDIRCYSKFTSQEKKEEILKEQIEEVFGEAYSRAEHGLPPAIKEKPFYGTLSERHAALRFGGSL